MFDIMVMWTPTIILLYVLVYPKYRLVKEVLLHVDERKSLTIYEHIRCATPMANSCILRKTLYGSAGWTWICNGIFLFGIVLVFIQKQFFYQSIAVNIVSTMITFGLIGMLWIVDVILCWQCADLFNANFKWKIVGIILPPLASYWIAGYVKKTMTETKDERKGTFEGGKDIT